MEMDARDSNEEEDFFGTIEEAPAEKSNSFGLKNNKLMNSVTSGVLKRQNSIASSGTAKTKKVIKVLPWENDW